MPDEFTPHVTPLGAQTLDALVVAAGYVQSAAYAPTTSSSSLTITQPSVVVVVPTAATSGGGSALSLTIASQTLTLPAVMDTFVDATSAGTLVPSSVAVGTAAPPLANSGNATRLYRVTTDANGVTALALIAPINIPLTIDQIAADTADYAPTDTAGWRYTLRFSLAAIRGLANAALAQLATYIPLTQRGAANGVATLDNTIHVAQDPVAFNSGTVRLANATANVVVWGNGGTAPPSASGSVGEKLRAYDVAGRDVNYGLGVEPSAQWYSVPVGSSHSFYVGATRVARVTSAGIVGGGGAASGLATLNTHQQVVEPPASGVRQAIPLVNTADVWLDSGHQSSREPGNQADYILLFTIPIVTTGGTIEIRCSGYPFNNLGQAGNWLALGVALNGGSVTQRDYATCSTPPPPASSPYPSPAVSSPYPFDRAVHAEHLWTGVPAGAYTVGIFGQSGGGTGATQSSGFLGLTHPNTSPFHAVVSEIA